jgi:hypothetical protein
MARRLGLRFGQEHGGNTAAYFFATQGDFSKLERER